MALHPRGGFSVSGFGRNDFRVLLWIGLIEIVATTSFYAAIRISPNPAVPSFLRNLEYLFVTILGFLILSENFSRRTLIGAVLTLAGAFIMNLGLNAFDGLITGASALMLLSTSFYAVRTILAKIHIRHISPVVLALNRAVFLFLFAAVFMLAGNHSLRIPFSALVSIVSGAFVGPFLTSIFQYSALRYIPASRAAVVQSTTGLFVLTGAFLLFGSLPARIQVTGGLITIAGVMLMMLKSIRKST